MTQEHPFAQYVRILGKGPNLSRPLTFDEVDAAATMIMQGAVEPVQLGAFLCLLRVKTETPEEAAGFAKAIRAAIPRPDAMPAIDLDWASYAGKSRQLPYYVLAALALAQSGVKVFMHGAEHHTAGRVYTTQTLAALGVAAATSAEQAASQLRTSNFAYMALEHLSPRLHDIMGLKRLLGLRSPIHTVARMANPFGARTCINAVTHPPYLPVHQEGARMLGERWLACFKGDGGEVERRPEKPCEVFLLQDGQALTEEWPALTGGTRDKEDSLDLTRLKALWTGELADPLADAVIGGTIAIALRAMGRAASPTEADRLGAALWQGRDRAAIPGA